ncbi:2'-5' RNA ligase family protein [Terrabacter terrigena]|uniref:2'-5' RNA ligase family protein n=1 Tax=Terrabacter terrigena TaxID=574718 RepID=A0ABW3N1G9_9MICO
MALALCLLLDRRSDALVRDLWKRLEENGIPTLLSHTHGRHVPHLSYAVLLDGAVGAVRDVALALPDAGPVDVSVQGTVVFPRGRVALAGSAEAGLAVRHARVVEALRGTGATIHRHYEPGHWMPHVSASTGVQMAEVGTVVSAVSDRLPLTLHCNGAALIDTTDGTAWPLAGVP